MEAKEQQFAIKPHHCGSDGNIKIFSLMQFLQEIATIHADELGFGPGRLNEIGVYWAMSNIRIELTRLPRWPEVVKIKTWPSGYSRLIATREFAGMDESGRELFRAGSQWMILGNQSNRPKNLLHLDLNMPQTGEKVIRQDMNRLEPHNDYSQVEKIFVPHSSIDMNGHVNNTEYVRWGIDGLRRKYEFKGDIRFVHATYLAEVYEADELDLLVSGAENGRFGVLLKRADTGGSVYLMEIGREIFASAGR